MLQSFLEKIVYEIRKVFLEPIGNYYGYRSVVDNYISFKRLIPITENGGTISVG